MQWKYLNLCLCLDLDLGLTGFRFTIISSRESRLILDLIYLIY